MSVDAKFNHQAFLTSHLDQIASSIRNNFNYISMIDTYDKSLSETFALLTGKTETFSFTKLKSHQYSALLPKIRIYRVDSIEQGGNEYEFIFLKDNKLNMNVLGENIIRDNSAGIRSINWTLAGTNPVTAEKNIECSIEFYFNSINAFSGGDYDKMLSFWKDPKNSNFAASGFDNNEGGVFTTRNYWALLFHPSFRGDNSKYDTTKFRIKAVIGWENIDPNIKKDLFGDQFPNLEEELQDSNLVMYLNLVKHDFSFKEDGSLVVKADYIGSIENGMFNYKYDLFRGLKAKLNTLNGPTTILQEVTVRDPERREFETYTSQETVNLSQQQNKLKLLKQLKEAGNNFSNCGTPEQKALLEKLQNIPSSAYDKIIEDDEKELERIKNLLQEEEVKIKNQFYSSLINKLVTQENGGYQLYSITLDDIKIKAWLDWKNRKLENSQEGTRNYNQIPDLNDINTNFVTNIDNVKVKLNDVGRKIAQEETEDLLATLSKDADENDLNATDLNIFYTTIGIILDSAHHIIENGSIANVSSEFGGPLTEQDKKEFQRNKMVFSSFDEERLANIANIPISYDALVHFLIEKIYKPQKSEYSLYSFIKDVITSLVEPALNNRTVSNNTINKYSNISLATNIITLKSDEDQAPLDKFKTQTTETKTINLSTVSKKDLKRYYPSSANNKGSYYFYYFIYDKYLKDFDGKGDVNEDAKKGIYHYTLAQDYGLVKSINFKRNDQPYLRESKSVGKKTIFLGQFRDIYAADVKMVGNNIYTPGMILLLKPSVEFGKVIGDDTNPSFSQITGVGGYYSVIKVSNTIDESGYSTSLDCLFHSNQPKSKKSISGPTCEENLQDLLTDQAIASELEKVIQEVKKEAKEQEAWEAAKTAAKQAFEQEASSYIDNFGPVGVVGAVIGAPVTAIGAGLGAYFGTKNTDTINPANIPKEEEN